MRKSMKTPVPWIMFAAFLAFAVFSYGFVDSNLAPSLPAPVGRYGSMLTSVLYKQRIVAGLIYACILALSYVGYRLVLKGAPHTKGKKVPKWIIGCMVLVLLSYPALSYDIFNYIATAKVAFLYRENPYVVMPIEIPNEPGLAYTRASNKLALYGPTWIVLTSFPYLLGFGRILTTIFSFKLFVSAFYAIFTYLIYRKTKRWDQTLFFALNPLVMLEIASSGHNDIVMMTFAIAGLLLWRRSGVKEKIAAIILFVASVFVKGATLVLLPLFFLPWKWEKLASWAYALMFGVFLLTPFREELYPWYAVWWLAFAAFIPMKKHSLVHEFSFWLSVGLMLRYVPWIATREYGGMMPLYRILLTVIPVGLYLLFRFRKNVGRLCGIRTIGGSYARRKKT